MCQKNRISEFVNSYPVLEVLILYSRLGNLNELTESSELDTKVKDGDDHFHHGR